MASAQLSSPRRAGAGSDLKETAPAPLEPCSGSSVQGAGLRRRLAAAPRHLPRLARVVQPRSTRTQAQPGLPASRARPGLPLAPTAHPREGVVPPAPSVNSPPRTSPVPGPPPPRGARPGEREPSWCRPPSHPETSAKLESQGARPASARGPGHSVDAPSRLQPSPGSLSTALPAFQRVIKCISGVKNPGPGVPGSPAP